MKRIFASRVRGTVMDHCLPVTGNVDWHVLPRADRAVARNGSAILTVCRQLIQSSRVDTVEAMIVSDAGLEHDLDCLALVRYRPWQDRRVASMLGLTSLAVFGFGFFDGFRIDRAGTDTPRRIYLHNRPWAGSYVKCCYRNSTSVLYLHNKVMQGAPAVLMRKAIQRFDIVVCVSDFLRNDLISRANIRNVATKEKILVVRSGVDTEAHDLPVNIEYDLLYVGRVIPEKGLLLLLEAMVGNSLSERKLRVVGGSTFLYSTSTEYEKRCHQFAKDNSLAVTFSGPIAPALVPQAMSKAKVIVVPSMWDEPLGLVVLEGMASTAAVVASNAGGIVENAPRGLDDGVVFFEKGSASDLESRLALLLASDGLRNNVAAAGQLVARRRSWGVVGAELVSALAAREVNGNGANHRSSWLDACCRFRQRMIVRLFR